MKLRLFITINVLMLFFVTVTAQTINVKIIETSDVHGAIFPYSLKDNREINSSLARVSTYLNQQRADTNQIIFLLDNGDIIQGNPAVYYYNFEKTDTINLYADVMNYLKYDAGTVGNHDIETGHDVYDKFNNEINFPWLAANAINTTTNEPYFKPYTTIERDGVKIAVLGMITPAIPQWLPEKIWSGMRFDDMIETAKKWVKKIRETEQPDLMIGLFHAGVDYTYNDQNENTPMNENASRLVTEKVPGLDVVFVGHDHSGWNFTTKNPDGKDVLILGTTAGAQNVAVANYTLKYDKMCMIYDKKEIRGELVDMKDYAIDQNFVNHFSKNLEAVRNYISRPVGEFTEMISSRESMFGPSKFVDLIHTVQLALTDADVSFTAPLSFNAKIDAGKIFVRDMFDLYRYENFLYTMELSGQEIKDYLEYSYGNWMNQMKDENDHLLKFKLDEKGNLIYSERSKSPELEERYYNFDSAAGIEYVVDITKPAGDRIKIIKFSNGNVFDLNKKYKVAINSYRGNGGGGHLTRGAKIPQEELSKRIINSTEKDLRYFVMKWIENKQTVKPKLIGNWKVEPENFWQAGKEIDYKLLFK
ncbi:MAG TPA: bifunctional UDP-sugar hydrolase/5'-nucleotidase [Ignavibacteriaceae bacterium]|nr:bifunctional UDP-sugar hydrolase/5'-nucleotidase [Ignavibacteriaceae bacterium]